MSLKNKAVSLTMLLSWGLYSLSASSEPITEVTSAHPPTAVEHSAVEHSAFEPQKVYVETEQGTYRGTRSDEHCFYSEDHDHIHCYDKDPGQLQDRVVYVENRTYRSTRPISSRYSASRYSSSPHSYSRYSSSSYERHDPIATGLGVGVAIGLPILIHHAVHDRYEYRYRYSKSYGNRYGSRYDSHHFGQKFRNNRHDRHDRYRSGHGHDRHKRHDRSRKYRANFP